MPFPPLHRLGFLPDTLARANDVYFRSTNLPRTIESLQQIVHGLYPTAKRESVVPQVRIRCVGLPLPPSFVT